VNSHERAFKNE
jgi:hypothetical protein